jgi:hypothetical protein
VAATLALDQKGTPTMSTRLQDKTALVTGATSNIGRAIVTAFAAEAHMLSSAAEAGSAAPRLSIRSARRAGAPTSSERISMAWVVHPPTSDSDDGHPGGVLMRGTPAETSGGSDATRKRRAIYLASNEAAVVDRTVIVVDGARRSAAVIAGA